MHRQKHGKGSSSKNGKTKREVGAETKPKTVTKIQTHAQTCTRHDSKWQGSRERVSPRERKRESESGRTSLVVASVAILSTFLLFLLLLGLLSGILHFKCYVVYTVCVKINTVTQKRIHTHARTHAQRGQSHHRQNNALKL